MKKDFTGLIPCECGELPELRYENTEYGLIDFYCYFCPCGKHVGFQASTKERALIGWNNRREIAKGDGSIGDPPYTPFVVRCFDCSEYIKTNDRRCLRCGSYYWTNYSNKKCCRPGCKNPSVYMDPIDRDVICGQCYDYFRAAGIKTEYIKFGKM